MRRLPDRAIATAALMLVVTSGWAKLPATEEIPYLHAEFKFPVYTQQLLIEFSTEEEAAKAHIEIAPLYDGYERAVSCRWDDNYWDNLKVKEHLAKHGTKATWYLNSNDIFYLDGKDFRPVAAELAQDGHSIGSHGVSHPYMTFLSRNRIFEEFAGVRIEWEAELDVSIVSHATPFIDYRNAHEGDRSQADMLRAMQRAGLYHWAEFKNVYDELPSDAIFSVIMPPENQTLETFKAAVDWAVNDPECREKFPLISHSMHGWYGSPAVQYGFDELDRRLAYLASFENFWHTNQNAYAAYRYQFENTQLETEIEGNTVTVTMNRPRARFLNDEIPLTLRIDNATPVNAQLDGESVAFSQRLPENYLLNVPHDPKEKVPAHIGRIENRTNEQELLPLHVDPDFPGINAVLYWDGHPQLRLNNSSESPIEDLTVTWRLPLQWKDGVLFQSEEAIQPGGTFGAAHFEWTTSTSPEITAGNAYLVAQLDFFHQDEPGRLYLTTSIPAPDASEFPRDGFTIMGPLPETALQPGFLDEVFRSNPHPLESLESNGTIATATAERPLARFDTRWLNPEVVPIQADWYLIHSPAYLLQTMIDSPEEQPFQLLCHREDVREVWLNGAPLADYQGTLSKGENHFAFLYHHEGTRTPARHSAAFLRFAAPDSDTRLTTLKFRTPGAKGEKKS